MGMIEPTDATVTIEAGDYALSLAPACGGSITAFAWRGKALMRPAAGASALNASCFPLVPFSNRIAHGRFAWGGRAIEVAPNFPDCNHPHPIHGFGWLAPWEVREAQPSFAILSHNYPGGDWPWLYRAGQQILLAPDGLTMKLSLTNIGGEPMPAGLGFHPFFPRTAMTRYRGLPAGEWQNEGDCLPIALDRRKAARDWWGGAPVGSCTVDTVYAQRDGPLTIAWADRGVSLEIAPSANLPFTVVYTPENADWFCVEPVSHMTNAVNAPMAGSGLVTLEPGNSHTCAMTLRASASR